MKGKHIRPGLQIISLQRLLQRFSMHQTKQRDYHNPANTHYNNQFSAVEIRLDCIPATMGANSTVWRQTTISS